MSNDNELNFYNIFFFPIGFYDSRRALNDTKNLNLEKYLSKAYTSKIKIIL